MVVIQEKKTYFASSMLNLPHGVREEEPTATFCQINYVNMGLSGNWREQHTLNSYISQDGVLLVRYRRNEWSQFVGVLIAK